MKKATLAIVMRGNEVLLGYKKKGEIGSKTLNGPGGKLEEGETLEECLVRETREELDFTLDKDALHKVAVITFFAAGEPDFEVHVFRTDKFSGEPHETADMIPAWFPTEALPVHNMLDSDRAWFSKAVAGEKFNAKVYYRKRAADFDHIEFLPFTEPPA